MEKRLRELIEKARDGGPEQGQTLASYLRRQEVDLDLLVALAQADETGLRVAAVSAARGRSESEVLEAMAILADDEAPAVRHALAAAWAARPDWVLPTIPALRLLADLEFVVRLEAARAAGGRDDLVPRLKELLAEDDVWDVREAAAKALVEAPPADVLPQLLHSLARDDDRDVSMACAAAVDKHLGQVNGWPEELEPPSIGTLQACAERLEALGSERFPRLAPWVAERAQSEVDPERLAQFGTDLAVEIDAGRLPRGYGVDETCARVEEALLGEAPRAVVLVGDSGSGKSAIVCELAHRLRGHAEGPGWHVLRLSPSELLVDTKYLGEWQTRLRDLLNLIRQPRRVILYVTDLHQLPEVGRSSNSDANVASMLAPHIESGNVVVLGETTVESYRDGLSRHPSIARLFRRLDVEPMTEAQTLDVAHAVCIESGVEATDRVIDRLLELAAFYLPATVEPGRSIGLLRRALERHEDADATLTAHALLQTLSATTGVPLGMLDDDVPLDLDQVRSFFESRVLGQPEAVGAVVDLVALIKAGLADPSKPFGVFFFVGPTGVGKTELARATAELLFGDPSRLRRFDMSEYATYDAFERLMGGGRRPGLLTEAVRESPFAVFLLDEVEKAHLNVFDLCLQIFDAGRLTDGQGRTADFRKTIFILTSNLGANVPADAEVGFGAGVPPPPDAAATFRELRQFFRPEFLGRIDRVIHFRPLAAETAEWIAQREVEQVLERSGITRRRLTIDVDPAVTALMLRFGYSPALGARPLKRTVERLVLNPVAHAVATGAVSPGSILRLTVRGDQVKVAVEPPEGAPAADGAHAPAKPTVLRELDARAQDLVDTVEAHREARQALEERRQGLLARSREPGFWDDAEEARRVLGEIHRWEGVLAAFKTLARRARDTQRHVNEATGRRQRLQRLDGRLDELDREAQRLAFLLACRDPRDLSDALVTVTKVRAEGRGLEAVERLARMYLAFAPRRGLEAEVLDDHRTTDPHEDVITIRVTGAGAFGLLAGEAGLHQLVKTRAATHGADGRPRHARSRPRRDRELVRVDVLPLPDEETVLPEQDVRVKTRPLKGAPGRLLEKPSLEMTLLHTPTMTSIRAWGKGTRDALAARVLPILQARLGAGEDTTSDGAVMVRRYEMGASPLVRDRRSGRQTGHLGRVLEGDLDLVLGPPSDGER